MLNSFLLFKSKRVVRCFNYWTTLRNLRETKRHIKLMVASSWSRLAFPVSSSMSKLFSGIELGVRSALSLRRNAMINFR
ncbi:hypothetical protein AMTRI_Chr05g67070 [Amborella trichopoda]